MVGPKKQDFWPRIYMLKGYLFKSVDELQFVKKCQNRTSRLLIMDPSSIRFSKVLEKRCRYSVCRGTQPRAEYFIHTNYRVCSWHLYHVNNSTLWHNDATPAEKLGDLLGKNFPILAKQRTDELKYFFTLLYKIEILLLLSYAWFIS